jgi:thiamine-monophosphate kinase
LKIRLGQAAIGDSEPLVRLERPEPRLSLGLELRGIASACIDISDGLAADLGHVLEASGVGACLAFEHLPLAEAVRDYIAATDDWTLPLTAGDDYELCFTVPPAKKHLLERRLSEVGLDAVPIGRIEAEPGLRLYKSGRTVDFTPAGYEHFRRGPGG